MQMAGAAKKSRMMPKAEVLQGLRNEIEIISMQAAALQDLALAQVVASMQNLRQQAIVLNRNLNAQDMTKIAQVPPLTNNDVKLTMLQKFCFQQEESQAATKDKIAQLIRNVCGITTKYLTYTSFMTDSGLTKWAGEDRSAMTNVLATLMLEKAREVGVQQGAAAAVAAAAGAADARMRGADASRVDIQ